jgi:hypothetical protein
MRGVDRKPSSGSACPAAGHGDVIGASAFDADYYSSSRSTRRASARHHPGLELPAPEHRLPGDELGELRRGVRQRRLAERVELDGHADDLPSRLHTIAPPTIEGMKTAWRSHDDRTTAMSPHDEAETKTPGGGTDTDG